MIEPIDLVQVGGRNKKKNTYKLYVLIMRSCCLAISFNLKIYSL